MNVLYPVIAERAEGRCEDCRAPEQFFNFSFEVEHILPVSERGNDIPENLALACGSCNRHKSNAQTGYDAVEEQEVSLFHPRRDLWEDHFALDAETLQLMGLTATGRVTVAKLRLNSPFQIQARPVWIQSNLYP